jgi:hypothetical protein
LCDGCRALAIIICSDAAACFKDTTAAGTRGGAGGSWGFGNLARAGYMVKRKPLSTMLV